MIFLFAILKSVCFFWECTPRPMSVDFIAEIRCISVVVWTSWTAPECLSNGQNLFWELKINSRAWKSYEKTCLVHGIFLVILIIYVNKCKYEIQTLKSSSHVRTVSLHRVIIFIFCKGTPITPDLTESKNRQWPSGQLMQPDTANYMPTEVNFLKILFFIF